MIITKKKHERIVNMKNETIVHLEDLVAKKNEDIKVLNGKLEGHKNLIKERDLDIYKIKQRKIELIDELNKTREHLKDTDMALDLMIDKVDELEHENEELGDKILNMREDNVDLQKENNEYKRLLEFIKEMLRQYKWYIDKSIEVGFVDNSTITYKDMQKFHSKEGVEGIMKLYQLAVMMLQQ